MAACVAYTLYHHKVYGAEHIPEGAALIASNHASYLDPPLLGVSSPADIHFLGKSSLFGHPFFAWLMKKLDTHPIERSATESGSANLATFKLATKLLREGKKLIAFPEGRRTRNGEFLPVESGIGLLVLRTECKVVPTYLHGTYHLWSCHRRYPKLWGKTACVFGSALSFDEYFTSDRDKKELKHLIAERVMQQILALQAWYLAGAKGTPP